MGGTEAGSSTEFALTSAQPTTEFTIYLENVTYIEVILLVPGSSYTLLQMPVDTTPPASSRRLGSLGNMDQNRQGTPSSEPGIMVSTVRNYDSAVPSVINYIHQSQGVRRLANRTSSTMTGKGVNITLSLNTASLFYTANLPVLNDSVHFEVRNQLGEAIAYHDIMVDVDYVNYFYVNSTLSEHSTILYEGTILDVDVAFGTNVTTHNSTHVVLFRDSGAPLMLMSYPIDAFVGAFEYEAAIDYTFLVNNSLTTGTNVSLQVGYNDDDTPRLIQNRTVVMKEIVALNAPESCLYNINCSISYASGNPYTTVTLYFVPIDPITLVQPTIERTNGVLINQLSGLPLNDTSTTHAASVQRKGPGKVFFRTTFETSGLIFGLYAVFVVIDDDPDEILRYETFNLDIFCRPLYYGDYCEQKQSITQSMLVGSILVFLTFLLTIIVLWGDWLHRWSEKLRYYTTIRAVASIR